MEKKLRITLFIINTQKHYFSLEEDALQEATCVLEAKWLLEVNTPIEVKPLIKVNCVVEIKPLTKVKLLSLIHKNRDF